MPFRTCVRAVLRLAGVAAITLAPAPAAAQVPVSPAGISATWVGLGAAIGTAGIGLQLDLSRYRQARLLRLRLGTHTTGFMATTARDEALVSEVSLLAGRGAPCCGSNWGAWALGGGIVSVDRGDEGSATTLGVAAELFMISGRFPNIVASAFGNLNPQRPFAGIGLALAIGRMPFHAVPGPRRPFPLP